eukprot:3023572-Pyramimonas_sp.AAC.1
MTARAAAMSLLVAGGGAERPQPMEARVAGQNHNAPHLPHQRVVEPWVYVHGHSMQADPIVDDGGAGLRAYLLTRWSQGKLTSKDVMGRGRLKGERWAGREGRGENAERVRRGREGSKIGRGVEEQ